MIWLLALLRTKCIFKATSNLTEKLHWGTYESMALCMAIFFPEFKVSPAMVNLAISRLVDPMLIQFLPMGIMKNPLPNIWMLAQKLFAVLSAATRGLKH